MQKYYAMVDIDLADALRANAVFHTPVAKAKLTSFGEWDDFQLDAVNRTKDALMQKI